MNQRTKPQRIRPSILDRLINRTAEPETWEASLVLYKDRVLRDLEWLLNARQTGEPARAPLDELERSIYNYGLPDFSSMSADEAATPTALARQIRREIELFEPRLTDVRVVFSDEARADRRLQFIIQATLLLDPDPERVEFDSVLELNSGRFVLNT